MVYVLDVADLVEAKVERGEVRKCVEAADARKKVVVEVEVRESGGEGVEAVDLLNGVLAEADARDLLEALEVEGGDGGDAGLSDDYLVRVEGFVVEEIWQGLSVKVLTSGGRSARKQTDLRRQRWFRPGARFPRRSILGRISRLGSLASHGRRAACRPTPCRS